MNSRRKALPFFPLSFSFSLALSLFFPRFFIFIFLSLFFETCQREFVFISLQMGGSCDIDRLTNCWGLFRNVRRNAIITESTRISLDTRAGYNWMSRKMAALPAIFYRNRFRRSARATPLLVGKRIERISRGAEEEDGFVKRVRRTCSLSRDIRYYIDRQP